MQIIHYIGAEWNDKFIIAETQCGIQWIDVNDFTEYKELTTCKKCLNKLKNNYDAKE